MPVADTPVHPSTKVGLEYRAGCWNGAPPGDGYWAQNGLKIYTTPEGAFSVRRMVWVANTATRLCRQVLPLPECRGCKYPKDEDYLKAWR